MINTNYYRNYNNITSRMNASSRFLTRNKVNNYGYTGNNNLYNNLISQQNNIYSNNLQKYYNYQKESTSFNSRFNDKFTALKTSADRLKEYSSDSVFNSKEFTSTNSDVVKIKDSKKYTGADLDLNVNQVATAQTSKTNSVKSTDYDLSHLGNITLKSGSKTLNITADLLGKNNIQSMNEIASAINKTSSGVTARVSQSLGYATLEFRSTETGESHKFQISFDGDLHNKLKTENVQEAKNAKYTVGNKEYTSETNEVKLGTNITATLKNAGTTKVQKGYADDSKVIDAVKSFVKNYNDVESFLKENSSKSTKINNLANSYASVKYESHSLSSIGINVDKDGKLSVDEKKLASELKTNRNNVKRVLGNTSTGIASRTYNKTTTAMSNYKELYPKVQLQNNNAINNTYFYNASNSSIIQANAAYSSGLLVNYLL